MSIEGRKREGTRGGEVARRGGPISRLCVPASSRSLRAVQSLEGGGGAGLSWSGGVWVGAAGLGRAGGVGAPPDAA